MTESNIKFYYLNIFQINKQINELFFKNFVSKQVLNGQITLYMTATWNVRQKRKPIQASIYL